MNPRSCFIISAFLLLLVTPFSLHAQDKDCKKIDLTVEITDSKDGKPAKIKVTSDSKDAEAKFQLHILGRGKGRGSDDDQFGIKSGTIENLLPGDYEVVIHFPNPAYCSEVRKVTIN